MPLWGSSDAASNSVISAPALVKQTPNTANRDLLYGNTTANAYGTGEKVGMFGVDSTEIALGSYYLSAASINGPGTGGSYVPGDVLTVENTGANVIQGSTLVVTATKVRTVTAQAASGTGYANGDTVTCNTGVMTTNAVFTVTTGAANTSVASLALTTNGVFTTNPTLATSPLKTLTGAGSGATATLTMSIASVGVGVPGKYNVAPTDVTNNDVTGGSGTGANVALTFSRESKGIAHTGWVLRKEGSGGRAGRVSTEVLVAGGITGDGSDDTIFPDT